MPEDTIRIGLIGAGANTRSRHIPGFQAIPGVEVVAVANRSRASGEAVAGQFNIPSVYDSWQELLRSPEIDAICIGTWPYMHCPITLAALASGKHVLTEARMAMNLDEARTMLAAARAHPDLVTMIVPSPFGFAVEREVLHRIQSGYLGNILAVDLRASSPGFLDRGGPAHWRHDKSLSGNNIMAMGIWYEAAMRWTGGVSTVMARGRNFVPQRTDAQTGDLRATAVPEHLEVIGDMPGGGVFHLQISAVTGHTNRPEVWIYGSEGTLKFEAASNTLLAGGRGDSALTPVEIPEERRYGWRVEAEFIGAIRGQEPVTHTSFSDGVRYMAFTDAVTRSLHEGRLVPVEA